MVTLFRICTRCSALHIHKGNRNTSSSLAEMFLLLASQFPQRPLPLYTTSKNTYISFTQLHRPFKKSPSLPTISFSADFLLIPLLSLILNATSFYADQCNSSSSAKSCSSEQIFVSFGLV